MDSNFVALALFIAVIGGIFYLSYKEARTNKVEVFVCKDDQRRVFFMGEHGDFKKMQDLGAFDPKSCVIKSLTQHDWHNLRKRHKRADFIF